MKISQLPVDEAGTILPFVDLVAEECATVRPGFTVTRRGPARHLANQDALYVTLNFETAAGLVSMHGFTFDKMAIQLGAVAGEESAFRARVLDHLASL